MASILMVCTANICRSPMAEGLVRKTLFEQARFKDWYVSSAGTWAVEGQPASSKTRLVLQKRGLDLSAHRSRSVTKDLLVTSDIILTMERGHKEALVSEFPTVAGKIFLLSELIGFNRDIVDPIGGDLADFEDTAREIEAILIKAQDRIYDLGTENLTTN